MLYSVQDESNETEITISRKPKSEFTLKEGNYTSQEQCKSFLFMRDECTPLESTFIRQTLIRDINSLLYQMTIIYMIKMKYGWIWIHGKAQRGNKVNFIPSLNIIT